MSKAAKGAVNVLANTVVLLIALAVVLIVVGLLWHAVLTADDPKNRKTLISIAGPITVAAIGATCGLVTAAWTSRLQSQREKAAEGRAAEREKRAALFVVSAAIDTLNQARTAAYEAAKATKDANVTNDVAKQRLAENFAVAAGAVGAARFQAHTALQHAQLCEEPGSAIHDTLTALRAEVDATRKHLLGDHPVPLDCAAVDDIIHQRT